MRSLVALGASMFAVAVIAPAAHAGALHFPTPRVLPGGDPKVHPYYPGLEPSVAFDPSGDGHVYVSAPQRIPSVLGLALGADSSVGAAYWASADHGMTWPISGVTGAANGGGDTDIEVLQDHTLLLADLEAAATAICTSHDHGLTFQDCDGGIATNQQGPEDDREWLTRGRTNGEVYLTYHDLMAGYPIIERSTDGGQTFLPCGVIIDPAGPAAANYQPANGTHVSKPVVAPDGTIYVEFTEPNATDQPLGPPYTHLFLAVLPGDQTCSPTSVFTDHLIYENPSADLGKIFQQVGMDGGGNLYVMAAGTTSAGQTSSKMWLFTSRDKGATWSPPVQVNPPSLKANVFPTVAGGQGAGEAILGWFGTETSGDPNTLTNEWRYYAAATYDGGQTFNVTAVTPTVIHHGDICTHGILCGLIPGQPGNRALADFASAAIDPSDGCAAFAIPQDPYNDASSSNGNSSASYTKQDDPAACMTKANAGKNAASVGHGATLCLDRIPPRSAFTRNRTLSRRGIVLHGRATDKGCRRGGHGAVAKVAIAIARIRGHKCRYVQADGSYGKLVSCRPTSYLPGKLHSRGKSATTWRFAFKHRLRAGKYVARVRAYDASGNVEREAKSRNLVRFTLQ